MLAAPPRPPALDATFDEIVADLRRREFLGGGALALGALVLAGCGSDDGAPGTTATAGTPTTRRIDTPNGPVDVPANPQRVVCLDYFTGIFATELGYTPAGAIDYSWVDTSSMYPPYIKPLKALHPIGQITATDLESVVALKPDLILGPTPGSRYDNSPGAFEKLAKVAPAVSIDFGQSGDWRGPYAATADALNRTDRADQLRQAFQRKASELRAAHADQLATTKWTSLAYAENGQYVISLADSPSGIVLDAIGAQLGSAGAGRRGQNRELSIERVDALEDSSIILYRVDPQGKPANGLAPVLKLETFERLPAVTDRNLFPITWTDVCTYRWAASALDDVSGILSRAR